MSALPPFNHSFVPKYTTPPNEGWKLGEKAGAQASAKQWLEEGKKAGWKVIDPSTMSPLEAYALMISGVIPRPVGFVSSVSDSGVENLAPFSFFNMIAGYPATVILCLTNYPRVKDTALNIATSKQFTVNIISEAFLENANIGALDAPGEISEWDLSGLTKEKSVYVKAPRVHESAFSMECELAQSVDITPPGTPRPINTLFIATVKYIHVRNDVLTERGVVDPNKLRPIARLGDITYARMGDTFRLPRYMWTDKKDEVEEFLKARKEQEATVEQQQTTTED
ncbi:hypothetical protein DACRYDRAFT_102696 [Dacryopinax primogenitus]|uniref:Flavin reductase like domain-containing protein n=1 Tax=Dacryopinax primogenitus (strain DJM 731) TaxID=1858805 RepID=M5FUT0_DACPD|nr:uncharacterized protein DACRYDRAFT_102696 [Dacryopinax primogenitus]EJT97031.1 hypothetical protein DACRYDRAFT_102696 [Dacryopinax primogenitus]